MSQNICRIPAVALAEFEKKANELSKKSGGYITLFPMGSEVIDGIKYVDVYVEGEFPKFQGWKFIAQIVRNKEKMIFTNVAKNANIDFDMYSSEEICFRCDHCHVRRKRNVLYIIENENTGERMVIGSTCVKPFFGGLTPEKLAAFFENFRKLEKKIREVSENPKKFLDSYFPVSKKVFLSIRMYYTDFQILTSSIKEDEIYDVFCRFWNNVPEKYSDVLSRFLVLYGCDVRSVTNAVRTLIDEGVYRTNDKNISNILRTASQTFLIVCRMIVSNNLDDYTHPTLISEEQLRDIAKLIDIPYVEFVIPEKTLYVKFREKASLLGKKGGYYEPIAKKGEEIDTLAVCTRMFYPRYGDLKWSKGYAFLTEDGHKLTVFGLNVKGNRIARKIAKEDFSKSYIDVVDLNPEGIFRIRGKVSSTNEYKGEISTILSITDLEVSLHEDGSKRE